MDWFWSLSAGPNGSFLDKPSSRVFAKTKSIIGFYYVLVWMLSIMAFSPYFQMPDWQEIIASQPHFDAQWSVIWINWFDYKKSVIAILLSFFVCSGIGAIWWRKSWLIRLGVFISFMSYLGLISSFGKVDHYLHLLLMASFFFVFIPDGKELRSAQKEEMITVFWLNQLFILISYTVSGFFKFVGIFRQSFAGEITALAPEALGQHIAKTSFASGRETLFQDFILSHPSYLFSFILVGGFALELLSMWVAFKPKWHSYWGIALILFHVGILLTVGPDFSFQALAVALFIFMSPFSKSNTKKRETS